MSSTMVILRSMKIILPLLLTCSLLYAEEKPTPAPEQKIEQHGESHAERTHRESKEFRTNSGESPLISDRNFNEQKCKKINGEMKCVDKNMKGETKKPK